MYRAKTNKGIPNGLPPIELWRLAMPVIVQFVKVLGVQVAKQKRNRQRKQNAVADVVA